MVKATMLKNKYSDHWDNIYDSMIFDIEKALENITIKNKKDIVERMAYNAAFLGCFELHNYNRK